MSIVETHMSRVYIGDTLVQKVLKPVRYAFADFSTPELREAACRAEVAHNAPWAPDVYLGVVPAGAWSELEHAIEMRRLPEDRTLASLAPTLDEAAITKVGAYIREVHARLPRRPEAALTHAVDRRILDNHAELSALGGVPLPLLHRMRDALARGLRLAGPELEARAARGQLLHGDLRAEHVYDLPEGTRILDGVAFNDALAVGDPAEDIAFLVMDLTANFGRWDLEDALWSASGIDVGPAARALYVAHRALIRAKVGLLAGRPEEAVRLVVHALSRLEAPPKRPALVAVGGLPGVGKSSLARQLELCGDFEVLRSDVVRRSGEVDYSVEGRTAVYERLLASAEERLLRGERVVVDASFSRSDWRDLLRGLGRRTGLRPTLFLCEAPEAVVRARLEARVDDPSDADFGVYQRAALAWEEMTVQMQPFVVRIDTSSNSTDAVGEVYRALDGLGVAYRRPSTRPGPMGVAP